VLTFPAPTKVLRDVGANNFVLKMPWDWTYLVTNCHGIKCSWGMFILIKVVGTQVATTHSFVIIPVVSIRCSVFLSTYGG